jgi:hypothetical protein
MDSPHIAEALVGGAIASIPILITQLVAIGSLKRIFKDYPPHRHINGKVLYPKDYTPTRAESMETGD